MLFILNYIIRKKLMVGGCLFRAKISSREMTFAGCLGRATFGGGIFGEKPSGRDNALDLCHFD